jgi:hypothetical protein
MQSLESAMVRYIQTGTGTLLILARNRCIVYTGIWLISRHDEGHYLDPNIISDNNIVII